MINRTGKFIKNTWTTALYQLALMISGFIIPRIMLIFYGSEANGLVSSITQFVNYITLVEAGLSGATVFALYKPLADNDKREISRVVVAAKKFYTISGWIFVALVSGLAIFYPLVAKSNNYSAIQISLLVLIIGVNGVLDFFTLGKYRAILTADQKQFVISLSSLAYCILNVIIITIMAYLGGDLIIGRFVAVAAIFLRSIILSVYCRRHYAYLDYSLPPNNEALNKRWDALFLHILGTVHTGAPIVISTILTSLTDVSIYSIYNMVVNGINSILSIFSSGLGAGFGDLIARNEEDKLQKAYLEFEFSYYALITFIYSVAFVQILPFIGIYTKGVNDANYIQPLLGSLFVINGFLFNMKTPQGMLVISAGLYKETRLQTTIQATIAVALGIILGKAYGLSGILLGMCLSNLYRDIDLLFFIPKYVTKLPYTESLKNIVISILEFILVVLLGNLIAKAEVGMIEWILRSIIISCLASVIILTFALIFQRDLLRRVFSRLKTVSRH